MTNENDRRPTADVENHANNDINDNSNNANNNNENDVEPKSPRPALSQLENNSLSSRGVVRSLAAAAKPLALSIESNDGGEFGPSYSITNVLRRDSSVYCSSRAHNVHLCFKLNSPENRFSDISFRVTGFYIKAPKNGYTSPLRDGIVFISEKPLSAHDVKHFDNFSRSKYNAYIRSPNPDLPSPTAYFQVGRPEYALRYNFRRAYRGKYVLFKLLNADCKPEEDFLVDLGASNIDVQCIEVHGVIGSACVAAGQLL